MQKHIMNDENKTKADLIAELKKSRQQVAALATTEQNRALTEKTRVHLLESIFEHTQMMVAHLDPQFNFIQVNCAYAQADEREPSFFPGKNHFNLYPHAENETIFRRVVETGQPHHEHAKPFKYAEHLERGISYWDWSLAPVKDSENRIQGVLLTLLNVTERVTVLSELIHHRDTLENLVKKRTIELQANEEQAKAQYKGIPVPTYTWQKIGDDIRLMDYNDAAMEITSGEVAKLMGIKLTKMYPDNASEIRNHITQCFDQENVVEQEMSYKYISTGETKHLAVKYAFISPDLVLVHTDDITDRVQALEKLKKQSAEQRKMVNLMAGRELRMAELKKAIKKLRKQLQDAGINPAADDPLLND